MKNITIIGGGLGGLSAGALLSIEGFKVTLLEQHNIVGGCATVFRRKGGFVCEVGLHEMDGVYTNPTIKKTFDRLGVYQNIEFVKPNEFFKAYISSGEFIMPDGIDNAKKALIKKFPNETKAIKKYFEIIGSISESFLRMANMRWYHYLFFPILFSKILQYKDKSVSDVLNLLTDNDELKLILNANVQYYSDSPKHLSFFLHAIAQNSYYTGGGYFIKGGSYNLSKFLADTIEKNGGSVIVGANVVKATKNQIEYEHKKQNLTVDTDIIISNISPTDTYRLFDLNYPDNKQIAKSITTIYIGFSKNLKSVYGERAYSNFILDTLSNDEDFSSKQSFVFVDYSQIDSGLVNSEKSFGEICLSDDMVNWWDLVGDNYKSAKERLLSDILDKLEQYYPNIKEYIEFAEVATPKTMMKYLKSPNATAYGYEPTPKQFFKIPKSKSDKINNLYFVGQFVIAGGFSPTITSGYNCYKEIIAQSKK
jgi:all-trans-retinol 13,14-reductase